MWSRTARSLVWQKGGWRNSVLFLLLLVFVLTGAGCRHPHSRRHNEVAPTTVFLERPENNGSVNIVPCTITFSDGQSFELLGGDHVVVTVRPGDLWVIATSPDPYGPDFVDPAAWRSPRFRFHVGRGKTYRLAVEPKSRGSAYTGGWIIEKAKLQSSNGARRYSPGRAPSLPKM